MTFYEIAGIYIVVGIVFTWLLDSMSPLPKTPLLPFLFISAMWPIILGLFSFILIKAVKDYEYIRGNSDE